MERGRVAPISRRAEKTMDALLESDPEFTALKYVGRTSEEVVAVMKALRDNNSITALYDLEGGEGGLTDEGLRQLSKVLRLNTSISKLHIASDAITEEGLKCLADGLLAAPSVVKLSLWSKSVNDDGLRHLGRMLSSEECNIRELYLNLESVSQPAAADLQDAIHGNSKLLRCDLEM
eukprot:TRINITY_DN7538_c0_g2_i1.p2 TRINITY_DN7538_c0_g2~~TRINITY_DN7538_c0_g2_i1.p2  ORF type:complete len:177 (+),score=37.14 TRINITY_DN7538_c0_g2_i1:84-614(+)